MKRMMGLTLRGVIVAEWDLARGGGVLFDQMPPMLKFRIIVQVGI